ncbi:hypothetical protein [Yersinia rochesterensis]|uniref:hypothetical protein n=1 Tax=Yersinia rochesterensis TaxID=1604335 RepID=UPI001FCFE9AC|nr:hypothetical protein [Yersinia rochesterensis]
MIKTITAVPVERDANGFWTHPDYFVPANGNEFGVDGEFYAWKMRNRVTGAMSWMENEENAEELQAAFDSAGCDVSLWQPKPPAGDGWFLASIHDTEDGPVCYWLRPIECDPEALATHFNNCYAEAFKTEHLVAERDTALNTCSLIAGALGITGAVAGETIARVQQLVGENAALTDKAASELSNAWLLHRAVMTIQAALHCIHGTNIYEAQCWLESIADDAELVIPPEMMLSDLQRWFDENMTGLITHAKAVEIIKAEMSATTQALNEYIARSIVAPDGYQLCFVPLEQTTAFRDACTTAYEESLNGTGPCGVFMAGYRSMLSAAPKFAASLRGE